MSPSSRPRSASPSRSRGSVVAGPQSKSAGPSLVSSTYTPIACGEAEELEVDRLEHTTGPL